MDVLRTRTHLQWRMERRGQVGHTGEESDWRKDRAHVAVRGGQQGAMGKDMSGGQTAPAWP